MHRIFPFHRVASRLGGPSGDSDGVGAGIDGRQRAGGTRTHRPSTSTDTAPASNSLVVVVARDCGGELWWSSSSRSVRNHHARPPPGVISTQGAYPSPHRPEQQPPPQLAKRAGQVREVLGVSYSLVLVREYPYASARVSAAAGAATSSAEAKQPKGCDS